MTDDLLLKYITGQASDEEILVVRERVFKQEEFKNELARIKNVWVLSGLDKEMDPIKKEQGIKKVLQQVSMLKEREQVRLFRFRWLRYAAAILLLISISGFLGYFLSLSHFEKSVGFTEVIAAKGERSQVVLPDGSLVKLNSGSTLKFEPAFRSGKRTVILEGEAFFEVSHNPSKPFVVKTSQLEVEVLGTTFNVCSYPEEADIVTYLEAGKVKINFAHGEEIILNPSQSVRYSKESGEIQKRNNQTDYLMDWTKGLLTIKDETIEEFSKKLERRYNIKIHFGDEHVKRRHYTGSINDEDLDTVLEALKYASSLNYKRDGQVVTLCSK